MTRRCVTKEAIDTAREEFLRQLLEWEDQKDNDEDCCGIRVVIARDVTHGMLKRILKSWLHGLIVTLSAHGVLELVDVDGLEHNYTKVEACAFLSAYARVNRCRTNVSACIAFPGTYNGEVLTPDCALTANYPATSRIRRPLIVVEIQIHHLGVRDIIYKARQYLSEPSVERVVVFKLFPARVAALQQHPPLLHKAALAVVFERCGFHPPGALAEIQVVDEVSFGTAPLDDNVLRNLSTVPSRTGAAGQIRPMAASPFESPHLAMEMSDVHASVATMSDITRTAPLRLAVDPNRVDLAAPVVFDLCRVFTVAASGWDQDRLLRRPG